MLVASDSRVDWPKKKRERVRDADRHRPFVALINRNDPNHARCLAGVRTLPQAPLSPPGLVSPRRCTCSIGPQATLAKRHYGTGDPRGGFVYLT